MKDIVLTDFKLREEMMESPEMMRNGSITSEKRKFRLPSYFPLLVKLGLFLLVTAYFLWASFYFVNNTIDATLNDTTCDGYGCLLIIYMFIFWSVLFYHILKPFFIPLVYKTVIEPIQDEYKSNDFLQKYLSHGFSLLFFAAIIVYLFIDTDDNRHRLIPLGGLLFFIAIGWLISANKRQVKWHTVLWGLKLQFIFGLLTIRWDVGRNIFKCIGDKVNTFLDYAKTGAAFVYSDNLVYGFPEQNQSITVFAFSAISTIYFLAFFINILYYYGIMQKVVSVIGEFLQFFMNTTICESVNCAANIFLGQSEAPLLLKPYLKDLTDSEIHSVMTSGFATVSGSVLAAYVSFGASISALITASVMSAPAALCYSKLVYPETEEVRVTKENVTEVENEYESVLDAATQGTSTAFHIVVGICGSLIAFIAFVEFINGVLSWLGLLVGYSGEEAWTLYLFMGKIFIPVSYLMGVPWDECEKVGQLIGTKTILNEFVAYGNMKEMDLTPRSKLIATYAICGFSNPGSVGIMISAMSTLIPHKKNSILKLILRAFIGGALVCFMTACIAGMLVPENALSDM